VNAAQTVTLASLARYRHVLWLVDAAAAQYIESLDQRVFPVTALYAMSNPGRSSTLAAYASAGGRLWLAGGGAALASLRRFDRVTNNSVSDFLFTVEDGELAPGRLLHDFGHLQSAISSGRAVGTPTRSPAARGGWSGHGVDSRLSAPDYSRLPATLRLRAPDTDPLPPTRLASQSNLYYLQPLGYETVVAPNRIVETFDGDAPGPRRSVALDTLMDVPSLRLGGAPAPAMLYYHGRENAPFVFTGFDLWSWKREDCQALVDFVLGEVWGLPRSAPNAAATSRPTGAAPQATARVRRADTRRP